MDKLEDQIKLVVAKSSLFTSGDLKKLDITTLPFHSKQYLKYLKIGIFIAAFSFLIMKDFNFTEKTCLVEMPSDASKAFREPENCAICKDVLQINKIKNVSSEEFYWDYVKLSKPVVVSDGASSWPALKAFNFKFFKNLFNTIEMNKNQNKNCQFFPYKTEFKSLAEVFKMDEKRANLEPGQEKWYVGWNNCNDESGKYLKKYYNIPYFLKNSTENIALTWIFMGGPGNGAHMHVDNVHYPSWQAQITGRKLWRLAPPPECYYTCEEIEITLEPGEIIVVDTNRWYHQTFILPGEISITIGSEFD